MKGRVLIIDDEEGMLRALKASVSRVGYEVETAEAVSTALKLLKDKAFDVVVTDKNMPGIDGAAEGGMEIVRYVAGVLPDTVVIMMTGNATVESARDAMKMGAFDYLLKPFRAKEIVEKIDRAMEVLNFVQPAKMMDLHKSLREQVLAVIGRLSSGSDDVDLIMDPVSRVLDGIMLLQKEKERMMLRQREALAEIASLSAQLKDLKTAMSPDQERLIDRIAEVARMRM